MKKNIWIIGIIFICFLVGGLIYFLSKDKDDIKRVDNVFTAVPSSGVEDKPVVSTSGSNIGDNSVEETPAPTKESESPSITPEQTGAINPETATPVDGNDIVVKPSDNEMHSPWTLDDVRPLTPFEELGNLKNDGYATIDGEIAYMTDEGSDALEGRIVSINLRTGEKKILAETMGAYLKVIDGYLYYVKVGYSINVGPLYRINLTTGEIQLLEENKVAFVKYTNNGILYHDSRLEKWMVSSYDGSEKEESINGVFIIDIIGDECYYYSKKESIIGTYNMKTKEKEILHNRQLPSFSELLFSENSLFYVIDNDNTQTIEKFDLLSGETTKIYEGSVYGLNLYNGKLIFTSRTATKNSDMGCYERDAYIIDLTDNSVKKLNNKFGDMGSIIGDKMITYFPPLEDNFSTVRIVDIE